MSPTPEQLLDLLYLLPVGVVQFDDDGRVSLMNPMVVQMMLPVVGPAALADAFVLFEPIVGDLRERVATAPDGGSLGSVQGKLVSDGGKDIHLHTYLHRVRGQTIAVLVDVTEQVASRHKLLIEEQRYNAIIKAVRGCAIFSIDEAGVVDSWNESAERVFQSDSAAGRPFADLVPVGDRLEPVLRAARASGWQSVGLWVRDDDGRRRWLETLLSPLESPGDGVAAGFVAVTQDQTEQRLREEGLEAAASTDPLTSLANRRAIEAHHAAVLREVPGPHSVLMLDLDKFKSVNDTHGHDVGDKVLVAVAEVLRESCRAADLPGRLGGEEFAVILSGTAVPAALHVAERIRAGVQALAVPLSDGGFLRVTTSVGVADLDGNLETALHNADTALYAAKRGGRNQVVVTETRLAG